jgi:DinB superfamily
MSTIPIDAPGEYAAGLLTRLGTRDMLEVLGSTATALRNLVAGVDDATLRRPERPGKWAMVDVVQHLADGEMVVGFRVRMIVAHDQPAITAYDQDLWATNLRYRDANVSAALGQFETLRDANLRFLRQLSGEERSRYGVHSERGGESVEYMFRLLAGHDLTHLAQLERIKRAVS